MMNLQRPRSAVALMWLFGALVPAFATADEFTLRTLHLDVVRAPKSGSETIQECLNNSLCNSAVSAAAVWMGVPPSAVEVASAVGRVATAGGGALRTMR